jgi:signal transduction histidine kinase
MVAVKRAASLIQRLLAFSRQQTLDPKLTDVNRLIHGIEELFRQTTGPGIQINMMAAVDLWPTVCDPNQLDNALLNLVINARDAMPDGGTLSIETTNTIFADCKTNAGEQQPEAISNGDYVALLVSDTGSGMAPDVAAHAFDPFFTTKPSGHGTGLGLSMIQGFVRLTGGHVKLRSKPGHGTPVTIYLSRYLDKPLMHRTAVR